MSVQENYKQQENGDFRQSFSQAVEGECSVD